MGGLSSSFFSWGQRGRETEEVPRNTQPDRDWDREQVWDRDQDWDQNQDQDRDQNQEQVQDQDRDRNQDQDQDRDHDWVQDQDQDHLQRVFWAVLSSELCRINGGQQRSCDLTGPVM